MKQAITGQSKMNTLKLAALVMLIGAASFAYGRAAYTFGVRTVFFNEFEVKDGNNSVQLSWTVTEYNNKSFTIQRSMNGKDWEDVVIVPSKNSIESLVDYVYTLSKVTPGRQYYRLKYVDNDFTKTGYSPTRAITVAETHSATNVWPNPATDVVNITNNGKGITRYNAAKFFDLSGRKMLDIKLEEGINTINIASLPVGTYLLYMTNTDGTPFNQKIIKQ